MPRLTLSGFNDQERDLHLWKQLYEF